MEGTVTAEDVITLSTPSATMRALPFQAAEAEGNVVAAIIAANNFGPGAASIADQVKLRDSAGRTFPALGPAEFPGYVGLVGALRQQQAAAFGDRELISNTTAIQPGGDAFVLLVFQVAPDSDGLSLIAAS
jgi:hypothetical protein